MTLFTIPLRHAKAKWPRTLLLIAVLTLGLASMTGLHRVSGMIGESFEKKLISYGANILITPKKESLNISYGGYSLGDVSLDERPLFLGEAITAINRIPLRANIAVIAPKMLTAARISGGARQESSVAVVGVDFEQEIALKSYWEAAAGSLSSPGPDAPGEPVPALAGALAAEKLGLTPGQDLEINGRALRLGGVLRSTGSDDDSVIFVPLGLAQAMADKPGLASFIEVAALCSGCPIEDLVEQLSAALPGAETRALAQVAETRMYAVNFAQNLAFSVSLVILVTACAMLIMSMFSAVAERRREIGLMRAVGFSRARVFAVFVSEAAGMGFLSGAAGYAAGRFLSSYVLNRLQLAENAGLDFDLLNFMAVSLAAALAAALAAILPARSASRVEPAEALIAL
ncbi:MAG: FtsX-like permease family protein [Deltaproteobacteria bacterium]|jgi:putative ABC transport system permease protein|nr:FtsX-like permease family protein [Deltaproteobacteria bacterium]